MNSDFFRSRRNKLRMWHTLIHVHNMVVGFDNETMTKWINEVVKPGYNKKTNAETAKCYPLIFTGLSWTMQTRCYRFKPTEWQLLERWLLVYKYSTSELSGWLFLQQKPHQAIPNYWYQQPLKQIECLTGSNRNELSNDSCVCTRRHPEK